MANHFCVELEVIELYTLNGVKCIGSELYIKKVVTGKR